MDDIAAEAEVGKGTLYRYFSDKEELYLALLAQAYRVLEQEAPAGERPWWRLAGLLLVPAGIALAAGTTYYVNCAAATDGNGTSASPWNNLSTVNGKTFDVDNAVARPKRGTAEIWVLKGKGDWHHPVHIHFEEGQILSRNGQPPAPHEAGRKDVYVLEPNDEVRVFLRFREFLGKYMMHCHNLTHEDHAMMIRWDIVE